jgi:hypothetical protein
MIRQYNESIRAYSIAAGINPKEAGKEGEIYCGRACAYAWKRDTIHAKQDYKKACELGYKPACDSLAKMIH